MHVEIHHGDALEPVPLLRMAGRDRHIVEQAEAHGSRGLGMVAGRAYAHEGIGGALGDHLVDRERGAARPAQRRLEAARRHGGVGIEPHQPLLGRGRLELGDVIERVAEPDGLEGGEGRLHAGEVLELLLLERLLDGTQPIGPLRMAGRRQVIEAGRMGDVQGGHDRYLWDCERPEKGPALFSLCNSNSFWPKCPPTAVPIASAVARDQGRRARVSPPRVRSGLSGESPRQITHSRIPIGRGGGES